MSIIDKIGLSEYINCVLVNENVRNAMMIQAIDYREISHLDPITRGKLLHISEYFPDLKISPLELGNVIISKNIYKHVDSSETLGKILGYPCAEEFKDTEELEYGISIDVIFKASTLTIIAMRSKTDKYVPILTTFSKKSLEVLKRDSIIGSIVDDVIVVAEKDISVDYLIDKLICQGNFTDNETDAIQNILFNLNFSNDFIIYDFQYKNPIHIGILCTLLNQFKNDPVMAFSPLHKFPREYKEHNEIVKRLEHGLIHILNKSKT